LYAEYKNVGEGADVKKRVTWAKQLSDKEAKEYSVENIFSNSSLVPQDNSWFQQIRTKAYEWPEEKK
jgi:pectinesterase